MRGYNEKADIWSVGITALELAKGYAPYSRYAPMQVLIKTIREPPPSIKSYVDPPGVPPTVLSDRFHKFVARCLQKDPKQRWVCLLDAPSPLLLPSLLVLLPSWVAHLA